MSGDTQAMSGNMWVTKPKLVSAHDFKVYIINWYYFNCKISTLKYYRYECTRMKGAYTMDTLKRYQSIVDFY